MVDPAPPRLSRFVVEVIRTGLLLHDLVEALSGRFLFTKEDGGPLSTEQYTVRGLHAFLSQLTSGVDPTPGLSVIALLGIYQD